MEVLRPTVPVGAAVGQAGPPGLPTPAERVPVQAREPVEKRVTEERLRDAVDYANSLSAVFDRSLKFEYRQEADVYQVSVIDTSRDEVVRKIPPDEVVRFIERIKDLFGAMIDIQA
ncbi:MAG: flagellar protein FlaG [Synergistaceae bacterium]|nr:flagellar protein FlaG [Synergistota bacterium]NLM72115.1 flagellar protein FlaG [Synergistaceae bacterium]